MGDEFITVEGAREHNLKNVSLKIPRNKLVVFTGLSGSGKSSLAFDTIFAEGQRKYVESLSAYARQFLDQLQKPEADFIEGLSPAIAIEQRVSSANPRSTIATTTEIYDYLRLLYAHLGQPHCPESGEPIGLKTTSEIVDELLALPRRSRLVLLAPMVQGREGEFRDVIQKLAREGFVRARIDGELVELGGNERVRLNSKQQHTIEAVVDRLVLDEKVRARLSDSVELALRWGRGIMVLLHKEPEAVRPSCWHETVHSNRLFSPASGRSYDPLTPKHFSFNAPLGACSNCHGLGREPVFDAGLIVPDPEKSLEQGAIAPWRREDKRMVRYYDQLLCALAAAYGVPLETPFCRLAPSFKAVILYGSGEREIAIPRRRAGRRETVRRVFEGVIPSLVRRYEESESDATRKRFDGYMSLQPCKICGGQRLRPEILAVTLGDAALRSRFLDQPDPRLDLPGLSIMNVCRLTVDQAIEFFRALRLRDSQREIASDLLREIQSRLQFLSQVGLGYLTLDRESGSLSGGEAQRIRLATQIGGGLVGVLYILDEPSIGLHQRDNARLLATLRRLRDMGNSVLVVEHDEATIRAADHIIDLGPGAGVHGGEVVAAGSVAEVQRNPASLTGKYLAGEYAIPVPTHRIVPGTPPGWIEVRGACENNLKDLHVRFPLGTLTCVTGVSGSGKSTLVDDVLRKTLFRKWYGSRDRPGKHREIRGEELIGKVVVIDQSPIGRTPRSNPATYTGIFAHIRELFARLPRARIRGFDASRFSFNVRGGRCEKCRGDGVRKIEMQFLPPVYTTCEACGGRRYHRETLEITYRGLNVADVLDLTVDQAATFFRSIPKICNPCTSLAQVGLGYLRLGQRATTLSGGEAQRVKMAAELSRTSLGRTLYLLDEPTTGLHFHDVATLLGVLFKLRDAGNTLIVIEHHLDVICSADWVIDLGPEGGAEGGRIVVEGPPEKVAQCEQSHTGRFLRPVLANGGR